MGQMKIKVLNENYTMEEGATFLELANKVQDKYNATIALAKYAGKLQELNKKIPGEGEVSFITLNEEDGRRAYRRSVTMLMQRSLYHVNKDLHVTIMFAFNHGFYCEAQEDFEFTKEFLDKVDADMRQTVAEDLKIEKETMKTDEAMKMFEALGMKNKGNLFRYRSSSSVNVYKLGRYLDYYYGYMLPSTGYLTAFELVPFEKGFLLRFPKEDANKVADFNPSMKLFNVLHEAEDWGKILGVGNIGEMNNAISSGRMQQLILVQEALMEKKIGQIAEQIVAGGKKFVMIAGPSSSGKTSFSYRLSVQLTSLGMKPHPIGIDNYYCDRQFCPKDENGNYDFECLEAIDVEKFNEDMQALIRGETVDMPTFNFKTGKREYRGNYLTMGPGDVLVIEGIHGLNDKLSYSIDAKDKFKIYISALTQLNVDEHNNLSATDGRLLRRICRDNRTRATSAKDTIAMWDSVRRGENKYIFPFQESADVMFNSSFVYELAVIKPYVQPLLFQITPEDPEYVEAKRLLKFLDYILPVPSEDINHNSLFREFIGGSCFNV
ncbi:MAG: nucleoside kinase [Lachnospiraceae bacterium]|nr:nucleoside kinase [Lachnospiraceae bacterium]